MFWKSLQEKCLGFRYVRNISGKGEFAYTMYVDTNPSDYNAQLSGLGSWSLQPLDRYYKPKSSHQNNGHDGGESGSNCQIFQFEGIHFLEKKARAEYQTAAISKQALSKWEER